MIFYHNFITLLELLYVNGTSREDQVIEIIMPGTGIEPVQCGAPRDFKSLASTYSATQAHLIYNKKSGGCQ